jgi:hypothetical protein
VDAVLRNPSRLHECSSPDGIQQHPQGHLPGMTGKGLARLGLLVATALLGAGLAFGAMHAPIVTASTTGQAVALTPR